MGFFSWLDCKTSRSVKCGMYKKVYVLVPEKFHDKFGVRVGESCYDGYGHFGSYDIYELVAFMNREYLSEDMLEEAPKLSDYLGLWDFEKEKLKKEGKSSKEIEKLDQEERRDKYDNAIRRRNNMISLMKAYKGGTPEEALSSKYGNEWLRNIGIAIACYDEQNENLPYPIKITYDGTAIYEDCKPSKNDPSQGCY